MQLSKYNLVFLKSVDLQPSIKFLSQRERGQWTVYNTSPQSFIITFSYSLTSVNFEWLFHLFECSNFSTTNFHWGCT